VIFLISWMIIFAEQKQNKKSQTQIWLLIALIRITDPYPLSAFDFFFLYLTTWTIDNGIVCKDAFFIVIGICEIRR
jgi:hypothetical protein